MDIRYYSTAWGDLKRSKGWFGKLCLLALLNVIPIFGQIVCFGYLYGWARKVAWGMDDPLPQKIFANSDGKFWRRGWFALVVTFVYALVPLIMYVIAGSIETQQYVLTFFGPVVQTNVPLAILVAVLQIAATVIALFLGMFAWIGCMRVAVYDRLSAGFQFSHIRRMFRRDKRGILRILGMEVLVSLIVGLVLGVLLTILIVIAVFSAVGALSASGYPVQMLQYAAGSQSFALVMQLLAYGGAMTVIAVIIGGYALSLATVFVYALVIRAVGYWTAQFDVPLWGYKDDPLPFELNDAAEAKARAAAAAVAAPVPVASAAAAPSAVEDEAMAASQHDDEGDLLGAVDEYDEEAFDESDDEGYDDEEDHDEDDFDEEDLDEFDYIVIPEEEFPTPPAEGDSAGNTSAQ